MAEAGLPVPRPVALPSGALVTEVEGQLVSVVTWLGGAPLGAPGEMKNVRDRPAFCRKLGEAMAALHEACDAWPPAKGFARPAWDRAGLLGDAPLWGRFWEHPDFNAVERDLLMAARAQADKDLAALEGALDYGLIHADLVGQNVMWDGVNVGLIDFDDGGYGFRVFELATFLLRYMDEPDYPELRVALCEGYGVRAAIDPQELHLFLMLRAFTYPGWFMDRSDEPNTAARAARANATALKLAQAFMER
jgi:Ser/Thr protein kinase RdoA (MazF antagonist)